MLNSHYFLVRVGVILQYLLAWLCCCCVSIHPATNCRSHMAISRYWQKENSGAWLLEDYNQCKVMPTSSSDIFKIACILSGCIWELFAIWSHIKITDGAIEWKRQAAICSQSIRFIADLSLHLLFLRHSLLHRRLPRSAISSVGSWSTLLANFSR